MGILGVAALGLAGCGPADAPLPPDKLPETFPVIDSFTASAAAVRPGESVALSWRVRNATEVSINPGLVPSTAQLEGAVQTPALQASVTYTLVAKSAAGDTQRSVVITVVTGKAEIVRFEADPAVLEPGQSTTLYWETTGASRVQVSQVGGAELYAGQDGSGSVAVTPTGSTTYRITVEGDDAGPKTQDAQVLVGAQPRVLRFEPEEAQITEGQGTNLIWQVEGAERVEIRDGAGTMIVDGGPANGQQRVTPAATTTYTLIGTNMVGTAQQSTTVTVLPPGSPRILRFEVTPQALTGPGDVQVSWGTADADTVDLTADGVSVPNFPRTPSGNLSVAVLQDTLLMLVAENDQERTTEMVMVTVGAPDTTPPVIMHTAVGGVLRAGQAVRVEATIVDAETPIGTASLFYRQAGQANFQSVALVDEGSDRYSASIPAAVVMPNAVEYYIQANDSAATPNTARDPAGAPANVHRFMVQPDDQVPPTITVTPVAADQPEGTAVMVSAQVSDSTGVGSVQLFYKRASDALFTSVTMSGSGGSFSASIPAQAVLPPAMEYYLEASDTILPPNLGRSPATAPADAHSFSVVAVDRTPPVVTHTAVANGQVEGTAVTVSAQVTDDSGVGAVTVFYKARGASTYVQLAMTGSGATRTAQIPGAAVTQPAVDYYIQAVDQATPTTNTRVVPATAPGTPYAFTVSAVDTAPPTISHTPLQDGVVPGQPLTVTCDVVDGSGVALVDLRYRVAGGSTWSTASMTGAGSTYSVTLPGASVQAPGLEYYLEAGDNSPALNVASLPATAPAAFFSVTTGVGEVEPNDTVPNATPFLSGTRTQAIGIGAVTPTGDRDYWIIDVPAGATRYTVRLEVTVGGVGVCGSADPLLTLLDGDGTTVRVVDDVDGVVSCPLIDPTVDRPARALAPGRYYVRVEEDGGNASIARYELRGRMDPVQCGNGILESAGGELCDDGNTTSGDGCSATCQFEPQGTFAAPGGTAVGAIQPAGDRDLYALTIPQGGFLTAFTSDGSGGCPGDTVMELYGVDGVTLVGSDDDGGTGSCSNINPVADTFAAGMAGGTYWLRVRAFSGTAQIPSYTLTVQISTNYCGNGVVETGEQCDDSDQSSGDGCSATCQWETAGTASGAGGAFTGAITTVGYKDFYQVTVPDGYSIRAETFAPTDGLCTDDTVIRVYASDRTTQLVFDDDDGLNRCSMLDPTGDLQVRQLPAGTYFVTVEEYGNNATIAQYTLNIAILPPVCGDGWVSGAEQCDDGGVVAGDGCSPTCTWEGTGEVEPNDTRAQAGLLIPSGNTSGSVLGVLGASDEDWYEITVPAGAHVFAEVSDPNGGCPVDSAVSLRTATGTELVYDTRDGPGECGRISPGADTAARNLAGGTYYVRVNGTASSAPYLLTVRVLTPGCGDMYLVTGEACDDGNTTAGDGCSPTCQWELTELEPNNTATAAQTLTAITQTRSGAIGVAGDEDWYAVTVPQGARLAVFTHEGGMDQCPVADTRVTLYDATGTTQLATDDSDGPRYCSALYADEAGGLAAGTYLIRVRGYSSTATFSYGMTVEVR